MDDEESKSIEPTEDPTEVFEPTPATELPVTEASALEQGDDDELEEPGSGRSWIPTIAVGIAALALGLLLGYLGRGQFGPEVRAERATQTAIAGSTSATQTAVSVAVVTQAAANQELMNYLISQARHAKGPEDAQATIIEFSDFQ